MVDFSAARELAYRLLGICALAAAMDLLVRDEGAALGFRSLCGLTIALCAMRLAVKAMG